MRERILAEIKRLAEANGGESVGMNVFQRETGIPPHDWLGKYWAKWSDAVAEAGYTAKEFIRKQNPEIFFPKLAAAMRHYGRVPTKPEMELYRKSNPDFPWYTTLLNHFGTKARMFEALGTWAIRNEGFEDIASVLASTTARASSSQKPQKEGHVYLIKWGAFYKIGRGDELEKRVKQVRTNLPDASELVHSIRTDDPPGIEKYWHRRFDDKRANGEWFKLSASDVAAFRRRKYQ